MKHHTPTFPTYPKLENSYANYISSQVTHSQLHTWPEHNSLRNPEGIVTCVKLNRMNKFTCPQKKTMILNTCLLKCWKYEYLCNSKGYGNLHICMKGLAHRSIGLILYLPSSSLWYQSTLYANVGS